MQLVWCWITFLPNQRNSCSCSLLNVCTSAQEYIGTNRISKEIWSKKYNWNWSYFNIKYVLCTCMKCLVHPEVWTWNFKSWKIEEKFYWLENEFQSSVCLYQIKYLGEQPMCHNCASLCSLCKGKDGAKTNYVSLL